VRWWKLALGAALLVWVLGTAYHQARRRGRDLGGAVLLLGAALLSFLAAALVPRPLLTDFASVVLVIASVFFLALAMGVLLFRGFRR